MQARPHMISFVFVWDQRSQKGGGDFRSSSFLVSSSRAAFVAASICAAKNAVRSIGISSFASAFSLASAGVGVGVEGTPEVVGAGVIGEANVADSRSAGDVLCFIGASSFAVTPRAEWAAGVWDA